MIRAKNQLLDTLPILRTTGNRQVRLGLLLFKLALLGGLHTAQNGRAALIINKHPHPKVDFARVGVLLERLR